MALNALLYASIAGAATLAGISLVRWRQDLALRYSHYVNSFAAGALITIALAHNGWTVPSDGLFRAAYPASHTGVVGVISTRAIPTRHSAPKTSTPQPTTNPAANIHRIARIIILRFAYPVTVRVAMIHRPLTAPCCRSPASR